VGAAAAEAEASSQCAAQQRVCVGFFGIHRSTRVIAPSVITNLLDPIRAAVKRCSLTLC
jgi:hypothetical protein